jgi:Flp pilus assembly protein TadG
MREEDMQRRNFLSRDDGGAAIEMGVLFPFFLTLTTGLVDVGVEMMTSMAVNNASQAGAAYAVMNPADAASGGSGISAAMNEASGLTIQAIPAPSFAIVNGAGVVTVTASFNYAPILRWSASPTKLTSVATIRIE